MVSFAFCNFYSLTLFAKTKYVDGVIAIVGDKPVLHSDVMSALSIKLQNRMASLTREQKNLLYEQELDVVIENKLVENFFSKVKWKVTKEEVNRYYKVIQKENKLSDEAFEKALLKQGISKQKFLDSLYSQIRRSKVMSSKIRPNVNVSDTEAKEYYSQKFHAIQEQDGRIEVAHIMVRVAKDAPIKAVEAAASKIQKAYDLLKKDPSEINYLKVSSEYSDAANKVDGGRIGVVRKEEMIPELASVAFSLKKGGISKPVRSPLGFHIVKMLGKTKIGLAGFAKVKGKIIQRLTMEKMKKKYLEWIKELKGMFTVKKEKNPSF